MTGGGSPVERVGIVGCGVMGAGIAEVCARAGLDVLVAVRAEASRERAEQRINSSLDRALAKGKITPEERRQASKRIAFTVSIADLADRELVIEAIAEQETAKLELFQALGEAIKDPDAILATNTSSLPVTRLAVASGRPGNVVGMHFFNPVPVMPLVEIVAPVLVREHVLNRAAGFASGVLGKTAITVKDRAGFIVNALLFPYLLSAVRLVETGFAAPEDIDECMMLGCSHPMGPLRLVDLIGLDTTASIATALFEEYKEPLYAPPPMLLRLVEAGLLGKKSGRGFYSYA